MVVALRVGVGILVEAEACAPGTRGVEAAAERMVGTFENTGDWAVGSGSFLFSDVPALELAKRPNDVEDEEEMDDEEEDEEDDDLDDDEEDFEDDEEFEEEFGEDELDDDDDDIFYDDDDDE